MSIWNLPKSILKSSKSKKTVDNTIESKNDSSSFSNKEVIESHIVENNLNNNVIEWKIPEPLPKSKFLNIDLVREPMVTFSVTPNNAPNNKNRAEKSRRSSLFEDTSYEDQRYPRNPMGNRQSEANNMLLNTIHGLYQKFYLPKRIRFYKNGVKVKMNDIVSFKIVVDQQMLKFYMTVPKRWSRNFISAIRQEWGEVDIVQVDDNVLNFDINKVKVMEVDLNFHYGLSIKPSGREDSFMQSIASLASTLDKDEKLLIDFNIEPIGDSWKENANRKISQYKKGKPPTKEQDYSLFGLLLKAWDVAMIAVDESKKMLDEFLNLDEYNKDKKATPEEQPKKNLRLQYSEDKAFPTTKGYKVQTRVIGQSDNQPKLNHMMKNVQNSFDLLEGDNYFTYSNVRSKKKKEKIIEAVEQNKPTPFKSPNILVEKELKNFIKLPSKETLQDYKKVITQDNFTRTEIDESFYNDEHNAIPFAKSLDTDSKILHMPAYEREDWNEKGRKALDKQALDDASVNTMIFGGMGSGKTSMSENRILYQFGAHITDKEAWKKLSKSVIAIDVADGAMIKNIYERLQPWQKERTVILNHSNFKNPIAVNNADLAEFNTEIMKDDDYAYTLAEMESKLVLEILGSDKTISMDRWFTSALQIVHLLDKDWGYIEAMRTLIDSDFREKLLPQLESRNRRLHLELRSYHEMASMGKVNGIVETIQNRFSQLERDQKLWDCIAQKPVRDENGKVKLNFRRLMDGDEDGAYLVLIYIPKSGVSQIYRKFIFAHYFTKIWNVAMSREVGFAGREYRPETLVVIDEIHQIINIPIVARLFIDIFKENRKYSTVFWLTLHGWSSLAKAGKGLEGDIKQSITDNGSNLVFLRGGQEAFTSLTNFLQPMTIDDFNNLMNMDYCGIFAIRRNNKNHVLQGKLIEHIESKNSVFKKYESLDSEFLVQYNSPYGIDRETVREDNLNRSSEMIEESLKNSLINVGENEWNELEKAGMSEKS